MFKKGDRVRHKDEEIDKEIGVMEILIIKNGYANCMCGGFNKLGIKLFPLNELKRENE